MGAGGSGEAAVPATGAPRCSGYSPSAPQTPESVAKRDGEAGWFGCQRTSQPPATSCVWRRAAHVPLQRVGELALIFSSVL
mgnify:CR=1 FL=1